MYSLLNQDINDLDNEKIPQLLKDLKKYLNNLKALLEDLNEVPPKFNDLSVSVFLENFLKEIRSKGDFENLKWSGFSRPIFQKNKRYFFVKKRIIYF